MKAASLPSYVQLKDQDVLICLYVQPKASKNMVVGCHGDALKVKLTAPPVDGAANKMCCKYLGKLLSLPPSRLEIASGQSSRTKRVRILQPSDYPGGIDALIHQICQLT